MSRISEEIEVAVPVRVAYDQWTQFESFPRFMAGIDRVIQVDDRTLEWTATIAGVVKHWRAEITEQRPDDVVAWRSTEGAQNDGQVRFHSLGPNRTMVELQLDVAPEGLVERAADALGVVERRVRGDLERFRDFIESRAQPTGAWRGRIEGGEVDDDEDEDEAAGPSGSTARREPTEIGRPG
ncbi:MAG TPA: SRPBCC family protein [Patescibacteria group bacterium]|nr:SRPBCC family protein [Patescibacteria group bacterium]